MARILVRGGERQDRKTSEGLVGFQPGDVVAVLPDGVEFSGEELGSDLFRCLQVPELSFDAARRYCLPTLADPDAGFPGYASTWTVALGKLGGRRLASGEHVVPLERWEAAATAKDVPASPMVIRG